ncbi:MAG: uracil-DNA glycosylase [Candidatus Caldatribacteriota bacterium]|jgi:uracil-DNA glycosylase family 4|nr:uracil-DNA glycosylase [Atribacterota bacterium]MDD3031650.1 uracil-DNA glycosylase [Atribacterota bacterium]MDD3640257.1 uracil-DNA glycosylase [Atribacterota bacterium]MDD4288964.1 uracil-DNA glycosylase [Atribacterota bacterium]MDD4765377.1 uracil-DNA glycosylase [Atribacterota bacterium]
MTDKTISLTMDEIAEEIKACQKCPLYSTRHNAVPGEGNYKSPVIFIGEAPGEVEDLQGKPFVGKAGKLFTKILESVQINRKDVFITNILKCRPPGNRNPNKSEEETCFPYLESQIALIKPKIIVTLGNIPTKYLLNSQNGISKVRGQWFDWIGGIKIFPMFHPSYLLRHEETTPGSPKELTWKDIQELKRVLEQINESDK